jgi:hypothetical protein
VVAPRAAVLSRWFMDALAHRPGLPLYPGSTVYAELGLLNSVPGTIIVEVAMFGAGVRLYARRWRGIRLWAFVAFLVAVYLANVIGPTATERTARIVDLAGVGGVDG